MLKKTRKHRITPTELSLSVAMALAALGSTPASAFIIDTGNPDLAMRWDNSVRYNTGWRMENLNPAFANAIDYDETENSVKKHGIVTNRLDLLSEFDVDYQEGSGFRVSAAAWSENAYDKTTKQSPLIGATYPAVLSSYGAGGTYNGYAKRYLTGSSAEFLDAFVFGKFQLGSTTLNLKAGQHNVYWGEALYTIANGVSAGQGPIDTIKGATSPGAEAKELFLPLKQISAQWSLTPELSLMGQYLLDWKPYRLVPGGTYFSPGDATFANCASVGIDGSCTAWLDAITPERKKGNFGLGMRWNPSWLNGTMGLYYRKYDEKLPWTVTQVNSFAAAGLRLSYARDTELLGISLGTNLGPVNTGFELGYRRNTALNSTLGFMVGSEGVANADFMSYIAGANANIPQGQTPSYSQVEGARGNTIHALANMIYLLPKTALWDSGTMQGEVSYQRLNKVTKNANLYYSVDYACKDGYFPLAYYAAGVRTTQDGCATKDSLDFNIGFTPQWLEVVPGLMLAMPTSLSYGLMGNSPTLGGTNKGAYRYSIGLNATYHTLYEFGVAYSDSHVGYKTVVDKTTGFTVVDPASPIGANSNNHGWLSFHFKTSF